MATKVKPKITQVVSLDPFVVLYDDGTVWKWRVTNGHEIQATGKWLNGGAGWVQMKGPLDG